jgi:hypothetical protein
LETKNPNSMAQALSRVLLGYVISWQMAMVKHVRSKGPFPNRKSECDQGRGWLRLLQQLALVRIQGDQNSLPRAHPQ